MDQPSASGQAVDPLRQSDSNERVAAARPADTEHRPAALPLDVGILDHYTLIVEDADAACRFHTDVLGFAFLRTQLVDAGTAPPGGHDMLNHVLELPKAPGRVLVITEGLTDDSIFRRYLRQYGPGVHHVAYEVPDVELALTTLTAAGYRFTSDRVLLDPLTGLRQVFVDRAHGGYFIELLERTPAAESGEFTEHNMAALARTMHDYLPDGSTGTAASDGTLTRRLARPAPEVLNYLGDPGNLPAWTCHRMVRMVDGEWIELRLHHDVPLDVTTEGTTVRFTWSLGDRSTTVEFEVAATGADSSTITVTLPDWPEDRLARAAHLVGTELEVLDAVLAGRSPDPASRAVVDAAHLDVHQRVGL